MTTREYHLHGPQVEPTSSFWLDSPAIRVPTLGKVQQHAQTAQNKRLYLDPALFPSDDALESEFAFLKALEEKRPDQPYPIVAFEKGTPPGDFRQLTGLSRFLHLKDPPFGAVFDTVERPQIVVDTIDDQQLRILLDSRVVDEGQELARMFEAETPGLYHRHALNWLFFLRPDISPPRQARIWMGLDMAIYTALSAAWYYKWRDKSYPRLLRPSEYAIREGKAFTVHFDRFVNSKGHDEDPGEFRPRPLSGPDDPNSAGTPRHPAWPSGHSTYSAAATYMLEYFFSPDTLGVEDEVLFAEFPEGPIAKKTLINSRWIAAELRRLANNIGEARLWGGVHWVSDHVAGQRIGRSAAQAVIDIFLEDIICPFEGQMGEDAQMAPPPTPEELDNKWAECVQSPDPSQDAVPQPDSGAPDRKERAKQFGTF